MHSVPASVAPLVVSMESGSGRSAVRVAVSALASRERGRVVQSVCHAHAAGADREDRKTWGKHTQGRNDRVDELPTAEATARGTAGRIRALSQPQGQISARSRIGPGAALP